ncbi:hypothetical protein ACHAPV_003363 [Trichoderma viride]
MAIDDNGRTLTHWESEFHWRSISCLVESKPLTWLDHASNDGRTALHVAAESRNQMAAECLLQAGASYHLTDASGRRPIHIAAECGHRSITYLLLKQPVHNYGKDQQDERGPTALDWAVVDEHETIADAIRYRGGEHLVDWKSRLRPLYQPW